MVSKVYIDAQNVGHENEDMINGLRIKASLDIMEEYGFEAHAVLPGHLITGEKQNRKIVKHKEILKKLVREKRLSLVSNNDDVAIITAAFDNDAFILTNDRYNDHKDKKWCTPEISKWMKSKLITFDFIESKIVIPMSERIRRNTHLNKSPTPPMSLPDFKAYATNGGVPKDTPFDALPEPVQRMSELISKNRSEMTLAALGSQLKSKTDLGLKDLFGKAKHAARFLKSRGYQVRSSKSDFVVGVEV